MNPEPDSEKAIPARQVLGTTVHCVDYNSALEACLRMVQSGIPCAVSACNTHIIALARSNEAFHAVMEHFDLIVPDGYPLVWNLNARGASLRDRVYGPYLMKHVLERTPAPLKHFFFGGTPERLERVVAAAREFQPGISIAGTFSPPFRAWSDNDEAEFAQVIRQSGADFIWVALGGERQERWIARNLPRHDKGVFFAVGDAFELLAGGRPFAPAWMQRRGLTWLYRLAQEPRRLGGRYLKFNALFLYYCARDALLGTPRRLQPGKSTPRIAFFGSRGVPANYSGFEVVVEELGSRFAERGYDVTVYNRYPHHNRSTKTYRGMRLVTLPSIPTKSFDTISHMVLSVMHAFTRQYDVCYVCGVGNTLVSGFLRLRGFKVIINVDGPDYTRAKWGFVARVWLRLSEQWAMKVGHRVIADNSEIMARYKREHGAAPVLLGYGANIREKKIEVGELARWGLSARKYILFVARLTPENQADLLLRAFSRYRGPLKLVICGGANFERTYLRELKKLADERVIFTGPRYGDPYLELSQNSLFYVMPATIEATRVVLPDQMGMGAAILYQDCAATREVVGGSAEAFSATDPEKSLAEKIDFLAAHPARCDELRRLSQERARTHFNWDFVADRYERTFEEIGVPAPSGKLP